MSGSIGGAQSIQGDRDESTDRRFGWQAAGRGQCVQAIARQLVRRNIVPEVPTVRALRQQTSHERVDLMPSAAHMLILMQKRCELRVEVAA